MPRIPYLDGIRGIAILLVIIHHGNFLDGICRVDAWFSDFAFSSWVGVDLFFVLSGFLITGILLDTRNSEHYFRSFYGRRLVRIFPLYYLTLFFFFYIFQPYFVPHNADVLDLKRHQIWYWTYLSNVYTSIHGTWPRAYYLMHLWSVSVEEQFYLVWPAVVLLSSRDRFKFICLSCITGALLMRILLVMSQAGPIPTYVSSATRVDGLALGALIATMARRPQEIPRLVRNIRIAGVAGLAVILAFVYSYRGINMNVAFSESAAHRLFSGLALTVGLLAVPLVFGWFLVFTIVAPTKSWIVRILSARILRMFGKYSYCIYLWHLPFVFILTEKFGLSPRNFPLLFGSQVLGQLIFYGVLTGGCLGAAMISWRFYEQPFLKLKRWFPYGSIVAPGTPLPTESPSLHESASPEIIPVSLIEP